MEVIGFVSSILTIVEVSWKLVRYLDGVKEGGKSRMAMSEEITLLWLVFKRLHEDLDPSRDNLEESPWMKPLEILGGPQGVAAQVREQLEELEAKLIPRPSKLGKAVSSLTWPFKENDARRILSRLHDLKQIALDAVIHSDHKLNREIYENLGQVKAVVDDAYFEKLLKWLTPLNFRRRQQEVLSGADPYNWVLGSEPFLSWHDDDTRSLWCYGAPGAGKSVVAATVYAELTKRHEAQNIVVLVVFCSWDDEDSQSPRNVIASLLKQVLQSRSGGKVPPKLKEYHSKAATDKDDQPLDLKSLLGILKDEIDALDAAFLILDGLDEVSKDSDRASMVELIHSLGGTNIKIMVTSRRSEDIIESLRSTQVCKNCESSDHDEYWRCRECKSYVICAACHAVILGEVKHQLTRELPWQAMQYQPRESDIREYVSLRLNTGDLQDILGEDSAEDALRELVVSTVTEKSENIFLLARLHVTTLEEECITTGQLRRTLQGLSSDLDQMYSKTLDRIKKTQRRARLRAIEKLLLWIAWGQRPLSVAELEHALAIRPGLNSIQKDGILNISLVTSWSAGLLFIDGQNLVRLIHPTASRFFTQRRAELYPDGDGVIAHACLDYLNMSAIREPLSGQDQRPLFLLRRERYPLIDYAVLHSAKHITRSQAKDDDHRAMTFLRSQSRHAFIQAMYYLDPTWSVEKQASATHVATYMGMTSVLSSLLEDGAEELDSRDAFGATPLMYAAARGDSGLPELVLLLEAGADPTLTCEVGSTALIRAVQKEATTVVRRLLLEDDVNINAVPSDLSGVAEAALIAAVRQPETDILKMLVARADVDVNITHNGTPRGFVAVNYAVFLEKLDALSILLSHPKIDVNFGSAQRAWTPLIYAALNAKTQCFLMLLDHGADMNYKDGHQGTILMRAVDGDAQEIVEELIKRGVDVTARDRFGRTVLHSAAVNRSWRTLKYFLDNTPSLDVNAQGNNGETALHDVCSRSFYHGVPMLVAAGARCDIRDKTGLTVVDMATTRKNVEILEALKKALGYENTIGVQVEKSLMEAVASDTVEVLQSRMATVTLEELNAAIPFHGTPLHRACRAGRTEVAEVLLKAGADPNKKDSFARWPLHHSIKYEHIECVRMLLAHGADVDKSQGGDLPLWEEAWNVGNRLAAHVLLEHGARISSSSRYLQHALHYAIYMDSVAVTKRLVEAGASLHLKREGYTAIHLAEAHGSAEVMAFFAELGGDAPKEVASS